MLINMIGSFVRNNPFGTEIAFAKGLVQKGIEVHTWDPSRQISCTLADKADALICFKDHGPKANDIIKQQDSNTIKIEYQPDDIRAPGINDMMKNMHKFCDYAFTFDEEGARVAHEELGYKKARKLLVTADPSVYFPISNIRKDIDFCFVGSLSNPVMHKSRNEMIYILRQAGYTVETTTTFNPKEINVLYNRSKIVLNHATDVGQEFGYGYGYQCRHFESGFAASCLYSNSLLDLEKDGPSQFCTFSSKFELLDNIDLLLNGWYDGLIYEQQGKAFFDELMSSHTPAHRAVDIIDFIEEVKSES